MALIDTGSHRTFISNDTAALLGYIAVEFIDIYTASGPSKSPVYPISFEFSGSGISPLIDERIPGCSLNAPLVMLIGRDILHQARFIYNGPIGEYSLEMPVESASKVVKKFTKAKTQPRKKRNKSRSKKKR